MSRPSSSRSSPTPSDIVFPDPPTANISALAFSPTPSTSTSILAASWDHGVHHYRLDDGRAVKVQTFAHEAPVLDVCFVSDTIAASAGVDRRVRLHDLGTGKTMVVGKHEDAVLKLRWCAKTQLLVSGSADRTLRFWNVHSGEGIKALRMPDKVIAMDISPAFASVQAGPLPTASQGGKLAERDETPRLVVGMAGRHVYVYDLVPLRAAIDREKKGEKVEDRDWEPDQKRESSLKFMARDVRCMPSGDGYATSSIEGRIAVEFFNPKPAVQALKYAFKCHRETMDDEEGPYDTVYPVHAIAFHPT